MKLGFIGLLALILLVDDLRAEHARVLANTLNVRVFPEGRVFASLRKDSLVEVIEERDGWAYVRFSAGTEQERASSGWVSIRYLARTKEAAKAPARELQQSPPHPAAEEPAKRIVKKNTPEATENEDSLDSGLALFLALIAGLIGYWLWRPNVPTRSKPIETRAEADLSPSASPPATPTDQLTRPADEDELQAPDGLESVQIKHVIDGDTVIVRSFFKETRIRLYAIDCPESGQQWGNVATAGLVKMIGGKSVRIEKHGEDKYGRVLATLYVHRKGQWTNVNERMVLLGHAWVMRRFYGDLERKRQNKLNKLESWAKRKQVGLWSMENPLPPWQWRSGPGA